MCDSDVVVDVLFHCSAHGGPIREDIATTLWNMVITDRNARTVFRAIGVESLSGFIKFLNNEKNIIAVGFANGRPATIQWADGLMDKLAHVHFVTFQWAYGGVNSRVCREATKRLLDIKGSDGGYMLDCLVAIVPAFRRLAVAFAPSVGFKQMGTLPNGYFDSIRGKSVDAIMFYCTRDTMED